MCIFAFCLFLLYQRIYRKGLINMSLLEIDGLTHSFLERMCYTKMQASHSIKESISALSAKMELEKAL